MTEQSSPAAMTSRAIRDEISAPGRERVDVDHSAMSPAEVWETVDFWAGVPWPVSRAEAQRRAVDRLGWAIDVQEGLGYLVNPAFTPPEVSMSGIDAVSSVRFRIADEVTEGTPATRAFLGDLFTLVVREGTARLGRPSIRRDRGCTDATWEMGPARVTASLWSRCAAVRFTTPGGR
ncbi:DUF6301 family protein [Saccharothrix texasensis]|uniref:Uncharacterized protein n=1 Tax=Saccharothrix texasensis TaxID=103734 RepID=A0A3N1HGX6_9PSEU|nr:DUF6301 family protein [Saccharothrix texasensis]ROP41750.1 hypothetical protein EDD40_7188 [Saccharothrix texasensis]